MTIQELKDKIVTLPDNMEVFIDERISDFTYGLANSVEVKEIDFKEDPDGPTLSREEVLIISED